MEIAAFKSGRRKTPLAGSIGVQDVDTKEQELVAADILDFDAREKKFLARTKATGEKKWRNRAQIIFEFESEPAQLFLAAEAHRMREESR